MRYAAGVEYDGQRFSGWQRQRDPAIRTVQGAVEQALGRVANTPVQVVCAGRTDAGVHALGQVIHFDSDAPRSERAWLLGSNTALPPDVCLTWVQPVAAHFNARFLATGRRYRYLIHNAPERSAIWRGRTGECPVPLDVAAMNAGAQYLIGEHDFSAFRGRDCQAHTPVKLMRDLRVIRQGRWVCIEAHSSGFLHNMVRNITGSLLAVGRGDRAPKWMAEILAGRERRLAGPTAPPGGLYLVGADFPEEFDLPQILNNGLPL